MRDVNELINNFFAAYEARFADALREREDVDATINSFASCFVEASPAGINCGKNDASFREAIHKVNAYYRNIGTQSMKIGSLDITKLDDLHHMVKVRWDSLYEKKNKEEVAISFDVIYFLQVKDNDLKIFLYIAGDEQKVLNENGVIE